MRSRSSGVPAKAVRLRRGWSRGAVLDLSAIAFCAILLGLITFVSLRVPRSSWSSPYKHNYVRVTWAPLMTVLIVYALYILLVAVGGVGIARLRKLDDAVRVTFRVGFGRRRVVLSCAGLRVSQAVVELRPVPWSPVRKFSVLTFDDGRRRAEVYTVSRIDPSVLEDVRAWLADNCSAAQG